MPPQAASPAPVVLASLVTALGADGPLQAILASPGIYSGRAPRGAPMPFLVIDDLQSDGLPTFDGKSGRGRYRLKTWASDLPLVLDICAAVALVLDRRPLDLTAAGFKMFAASTELLTTFPEPGDTVSHQGVVNYHWSAQVL